MERRSRIRRRGVLILTLLHRATVSIALTLPTLAPMLGRHPPHRAAADAPTVDAGDLDSIVSAAGSSSIAPSPRSNERTAFAPCAQVHILRSAWSGAECQRAIHSAERHDGWSTGRHHLFPTTDIPAGDLPDGMGEAALDLAKDVILPSIATAFDTNVGRLNFKDMFLARYEVGGQPGLGRHTDGSAYSFNVLLSDPSDFVGGGTWIEPVGLVRPEKGDVLLHRGSVLHEGCPVTEGMRHVLVGFVQEDDDDDVARIEGIENVSEILLRTIETFPLGIVVEVDEGDTVSCAMVVDIADNGAAQKANIQKGDCIRGVMNDNVFVPFDGQTFESVMAVLGGMKSNGSVQMVTERWCSG